MDILSSSFTESMVILVIILVLSRFIKRGSDTLQRFFIPSCLVAGVMGLILGPQVLGTIPSEITDTWKALPKLLINVVFAGLFLGRVIPSAREIWKAGGPMIAFGNTLAWGQYVLGIGLVMFFLTPFFGTNPLAGALMEISFEGGHGTAAGLAPVFQELGWSEGTDVALALATFSIIAAIFSGLIMINWHHRKTGHVISKEDREEQRKKLIRNGYNLVTLARKVETNPKAIIINTLAFVISIGIGWLMLKGLIIAEEYILRGWTNLRFFTYVPLFPLAMFGGLIVQLTLRKIGKQTLIQRRTAEIFSTLALDVLIVSAVATVSLKAINNNLPLFIAFALMGVVWIISIFIYFAPRMFPAHWFENGLTNVGQSMGMTATGLLMQRLSDPANNARAREAFSYKQLVFEPFMGGGIITATSVIVIHEFGSMFAFLTALIATAFWIVLGLYLGRKYRVNN
jgi:ESS family glutamate:Na+ symporter